MHESADPSKLSYFEEGPAGMTVFQRFKMLSSRHLQEELYSVYVIKDSAILPFYIGRPAGTHGPQRKPYFDHDVKIALSAPKALTRSSINNRCQTDTRLRYAELIIEKGLSRGVRSPLSARLSAGGCHYRSGGYHRGDCHHGHTPQR